MANRAIFKSTTFHVGDTVRIEQEIKEGGKKRTQAFEGIVIKIRGADENKSFTVRRIGTGNIGIEKIWPLSSPALFSISVVKKGNVRRAKLYYLRKRMGKKATRVKESKAKKTPGVDKKTPGVNKEATKTKRRLDDKEKKKPRKTGRKPGKKGAS